MKNERKFDELLERTEKKLKVVPKIGEKLAHVPVFIQLLKFYILKEYTRIPIGSVLAIASALLYFVSPLDLIPDFIPVAGYIDDVGVLAVCLPLVDSDIKEFKQWRDSNKQIIEVVNE